MARIESPDFDAIVVGAGAGGAAAAYHLVQAGLDTLVIERQKLPRYKACGGAIPRRSLARYPFDFGDVVEAEPISARFTFPGLAPVEVRLDRRPMVMVMRAKFDAFLLGRSGAEILDGTPVTAVEEAPDRVRVAAAGRSFTARYLVAADGATSTVARCMGLRRRRRLGGTLEMEVPLPAAGALRDEYGQRAVFCFGTVAWGYGWVFPKGDHLSVGVGRFRPGRVDLRGVLRRQMEQMGLPTNGATPHGHPIPFLHVRAWPLWYGQPMEPLSTRRCVLVGDAAGLVDPLVGEGIRYAMTSGRLAAEAIASAGGGDLRRVGGYEEALWHEVGHSLATAGLAANVYYHLPHVSYRLGVCNLAAIRHVVDIITDDQSYIGIGRRLVFATLRWPLDVVRRRRRDKRSRDTISERSNE